MADHDVACATAGNIINQATGNVNATGDGYELAGVGVLSECVSVSRCSGLLDDPYAPIVRTIACGFDTEDQQVYSIYFNQRDLS